MNTKRCGFHIYSTTSHSTHLRDENGKQICQNCPSRLGPKPTPPQGVPALGRRPIAVGVPSMKTGLSFTPGRQSRTSRNTWWRSCCSRRRRCATSPPHLLAVCTSMGSPFCMFFWCRNGRGLHVGALERKLNFLLLLGSYLCSDGVV